ncbi:hypothetical protein JRO89_XS13G0037000 [Xanthoceras sorbifolium]|uniref:DUF4005 domain-containing protein n=1 Tax=Xanthoceras sorbifolium TaxID=99658 RepID=A0ABQ8H6C2_9ROSI|nr:hypothetical protein JRO89_XS13G0037000 [Xanthoceras sorbifolium]
MGRASKWFRSILGLKKPDSTHSSTSQPLPARSRSKEKRRWSFVKSYREKDYQNTTTKLHSMYGQQDSAAEPDDAPSPSSDRHAIAVAAATAAVAEAAVAAAQAAAAVVRLTSSSGRCRNYPAAYATSCGGILDDVAAIKIQSAFRGYLARRALRALRGLVRLQALVRGHIERKRTAEWLRRMQALLRAQARARAGRAQLSESSQSSSKSSHFHHPGPPTPEKFEHAIRSRNANYQVSSVLKSNDRLFDVQEKVHMDLNWSGHHIDDGLSKDQQGPTMKIGTLDDEKSDKILEIDNGKSHFTPKRRNLFHSSHLVVEESSFCTADNSPQFFSASSRGASSRRSPFTPTKSYGSQSCLSGYSDHPNYMAYTESSRAKVRSLSAPKLRPQSERSNSTKRYSVHGTGESKTSAQRFSSLHASFTNKAYPGSGRLDRLGMPVGHRY